MLNNIKENTSSVYIHVFNQDLNNLLSRYKFIKRDYVSYWIDNLNYIYDKSNDNQCLMRYILLNVEKSEKYIINEYQDIKMPIHTFPCLKYDFKEDYSVYEHKLNSRTTLCIQEKNVYIVYKHKKSCDIENYLKDIDIFM